ncbi:MAG: DUF4276 family protein [Thermoguttaceae bacterium]|nr:DUF4276 family protein [Thermoguttaceae bacterium]
MTSILIHLVFEDVITQNIMKKMLCYFQGKYQVGRLFNCCGHDKIRGNFHKYVKAAQNSINWIIITDLDRLPCVHALKEKWKANKYPDNLIFRIAVHEVESWLLADGNNFSKYFAVSKSKIPQQPDEVVDVKEKLISIVRKSRIKEKREGIIPIDKYAAIGPRYNDILSEFVREHWSLDTARENSPSLDRALRALDVFQPISQ